MDPRIEHPHGHIYDHDTHNAGLLPAAEGHDDEHSHEKKSVLKKVKAKAKKIKDTLKKHGHDHGHDHEHHPDESYSPDDHDLDGEDDEDGEMVEDPEVHDGTEFEFVAVGSAKIPVETENSGNSGFHFGRLAAAREDTPSPGESHEGKVIKPSIKGIEPNTGQPIFKFENPTVSGEEPHAPQNTPVSPPPGHYNCGTKVTDPTKTFVPGEEGSTGQPKVTLGKPMGLEEDPHAPDRAEPHTSANYQAKVTDPTGTGGEEAGIAPILQSFDKLKVHDEPKPNPAGPDENLPTAISNQFTKSPTGSHDQYSPEPVPPAAKIFRDKSQLPESFDATKLPDDSRDISEEPLNHGSYTEKISSATSAIADKAISAKNAIASKLGYGETDMTSGTEVRQSGDNAKSSSAEYGKKIAATVSEKLTPVYEKVAEAGSTVISKVHGTGTADTDPGIGNESQSWDVKGQDKGVSVKDYFLEKLRPGNEDRALAEVISDALHKPNEEPGKGKMRPMGEVTESEEVARRLGTKEDNYCQGMQSSDIVNNSQAGKGVVDKLKGAVGSWFGIRGESQPQVSPQLHGSSYGDEGIPGSANGDGGNSSPTADKGRRLQEN